MSLVGAIFVPFPPKTGTNMLHPLSPPIVEHVLTGGCSEGLGAFRFFFKYHHDAGTPKQNKNI